MSNSISASRRNSVIIRWIVALILMFFAVYPVLFVLSSSFNASSTLSSNIIPTKLGLGNYQRLFNPNCTADFLEGWGLTDMASGYRARATEGCLFPYITWLWNSIKIATITTLLSVSITTLAAYAFSRFRFYGRNTMLKVLLLIQVFPSLLAMIAVFLVIQDLGSVIPWLNLNTHAALILVYLGGAMGVNIWLMKGFFDTIPRAIDESAMVDGATHWQTFTLLLLPLMRPILVVVAILSFIGTYGDFVLARVLLKETNKYPLMVGLQIFTSGQFSQQWGPFTAGALLGALPIMIIYLILQDQIVGGLTQGAVKG